ncbi:uncharacterized protein LOC106641996 [Copidosoma floridanum]|uniref:uncharacterized protein LOC106641996 n=1 Tax=Copidosoma floridanum TaxID=29053 RepID=UPI0006C9DD6F|nr:uncharacterized protein LOC106641996 [Copidosoma floridanum]
MAVYLVYRKHSCSSVLVLIGLILIPLCALIIFIQLKGCTVSHQSPSSISSEFLDGDNLDSLYSKCVDEKNNLLQLIHDFLGSSGPNKLLQNYKSTINNKEELEKSLENLRDQLKILHIKKEKLEWLLDNVNKTFTQLTYSDNTNVKNEDTSTGENTEVKSASSEQKSQTVREKSIQERINEWSKMPPDTAIKIETAIQKVKDFMESNDKT